MGGAGRRMTWIKIDIWDSQQGHSTLEERVWPTRRMLPAQVPNQDAY